MKNKIVPFLLSTLLMATTVWAAATEEISMPVIKTAEVSPTPLPLDTPESTLTPTPIPTGTPIPAPTEKPPEPSKTPAPMPEVTIAPEVLPLPTPELPPEEAPAPEPLPETTPAPQIPAPSATPIPAKVPEEELLVMDESNLQELEAGDDKSQELIEEIEAGNLLALTIAEPNRSRAAGKYTLINNGYLYADEVWTQENYQNQDRMATSYYQIEYIDAKGQLTRAPAYCIESNKLGIAGQGDSEEIKDEAVKILTDENMKKLLYFGWGGPGDICDSYDPTCEHITWDAENRYVFTHFALSKIYCGQVGYATAQEIEHVGLNRFIDYILSLQIPSRDGTKLLTYNKDGIKEESQHLNVDLKICRNAKAAFPFVWNSFGENFRITNMIYVSDSNMDNGIQIVRNPQDTWQLAYWESWEDYESRGEKNPRIGPEEGTVQLKSGAYFYLVFPLMQLQPVTFTFSSILNPLTYLWLDAEEEKDSSYQDYGFVTHEGTYINTSLTVNPLPMGSLLLEKTCAVSGSPVAKAQYTLYAGEDIYSGMNWCFKKDSAVETCTTDPRGKSRFNYLPPGRYYVKETLAAPGYQLDNRTYPVTVVNNYGEGRPEKVLRVQDEPEKKATGQITVTKKIRESDILWVHGNPAFFFRIEGTDSEGRTQQFEDFLSFQPGNYKKDKNGYAYMNLTFSQIPEGRYQVYELPTLRYYLKSAAADTQNVTIINGKNPAFGLMPKEISYGEAVISQTFPTARLTFVNEKARFDGYSHSQVIKNKIPLSW